MFPLEILPAAMMGALSYDLLIGFLLCLLGVFFLGTGIGLSILYVPIILGPVFLIALGLAWFFQPLGFLFEMLGKRLLF